MASPANLTFDKLLAPIPGEQPTGRDLRKDSSPTSIYYTIKDARSAARTSERKIEVSDKPQDEAPPDWRKVLQPGIKALTETTKDLEITAYMIEALLRLHSFGGLRDGFRLARELVERFWDGLYPSPEDEGIPRRVAPLTGLNGDDAEGTLLRPLKRVPITGASGADNYCLAQYEDAIALGRITDAKAREKKLAEKKAVSLEMIEKAVADTSAPFYRQLFADLTECITEFANLGKALDQRCAGDTPPSSSIRESLEACRDAIKTLAKEKVEPPAAPVPAPAADPEAKGGAPAAPGAPAPAVPADVIRTREDAFRSLLKVAEFFRKTEPHTVVSYALEQVVRWGQMNLPDLLSELIPEDAPRKNLFKQVGIRPEAPKSESPKK